MRIDSLSFSTPSPPSLHMNASPPLPTLAPCRPVASLIFLSLSPTPLCPSRPLNSVSHSSSLWLRMERKVRKAVSACFLFVSSVEGLFLFLLFIYYKKWQCGRTGVTEIARELVESDAGCGLTRHMRYSCERNGQHQQLQFDSEEKSKKPKHTHTQTHLSHPREVISQELKRDEEINTTHTGGSISAQPHFSSLFYFRFSPVMRRLVLPSHHTRAC